MSHDHVPLSPPNPSIKEDARHVWIPGSPPLLERYTVPDHNDRQDVPFFVSRDDDNASAPQEEEEEIFSSVSKTPSPSTVYGSSPPPMPPHAQRPPITGGYRAVASGPAAQAPHASQAPYLDVLDDQGKPMTALPLHRERTIIGQSNHCDAPYTHPLLSPWHAALVRTPEGKIMLEDLQSINGVFLGIADDFQLEDGDHIALGRQRFLFRSTTPPPSVLHAPDHASAPLFGAPCQGHYPHLIRLLAGGLIGGLYPLNKPLVIGRGMVDISLPEDYVLEDRHAQIERKGPHFTLRDLGSRTGSYIRVYSPVELIPGDRFLLGNLQFCLRSPTSP